MLAIVCIIYYLEVFILNLRTGSSIKLMQRMWIPFYIYILIELIGFLALFVPVLTSQFSFYLVEPNVIQIHTILMSTAILLSSGFFANIAFWALLVHQTYMWLISIFMCILSLTSFMIIEWQELKVTTPAFNTSCFHSSIITLEASQGFGGCGLGGRWWKEGLGDREGLERDGWRGLD